ncbi:TauD/TfdA family dioxygenase [Aquimarina rhabdastrellae]
MKSKSPFPFIWEKETSEIKSLPELLNKKSNELKILLSKNGVILFKSFEINTPEKLEECVNAFPGSSLNYLDGTSPRTKLQNKVYTSTEYPPEEFISLHNELSYSNSWPSFLFFCCEIPAETGGSTAIADSRLLLSDLSESTRKLFKKNGVMYIRNLHGGFGFGTSWQNAFETEDKLDVEKYCENNEIDYVWNDEGGLRLLQKREAIITHPISGDEVWFNQADQFHPSQHPKEVYEAMLDLYEGDYMKMPQYATFGNGDEIPIECFDEVREVAKKNMVTFKWEKGDLMLVDNILAAHGRTPFVGDRRILVSMLA